jgi:hypothetical protein
VKNLQFEVVSGRQADGEPLNFTPSRILCAGYTGRNQEEVRRHVAELARIGVAAPPRVPYLYRVAPYLLTYDESIQVKGEKTSGEVEYVILVSEKEWYITIGSDHTDRELEKISVDKAKQICPKVLARQVWRYSDVKDHWDEIKMMATATKGPNKSIYQEGKLGLILRPESLIETFTANKPGTVLFSGTVPLKSPDLIYADQFKMKLEDSVMRREICHEYRVEAI